MDASQYLGWAQSLLDDMGVSGAIIAFIIIMLAVAFVRSFIDR